MEGASRCFVGYATANAPGMPRLACKCPWDATTCIAAAKRGYLPVLQWARKNHCAWDDGVTLAAVAGPEPNQVDQTGRGGDAALFFWCVERGCRIEPEPSLVEVLASAG